MHASSESRLSGFLAGNFPKFLLGAGILGLLASAALYPSDPKRFFFSYLTAFMFFLTISLGSLFFVTIHHLVRSGWSVVVRRIPEHLMKNVLILAVLFIPVLFGMHHLYEWTHTAEVAKDLLLQKKSPYLNTTFFFIRVAFYFGVWFLLARKYFNNSVKQDESGDEKLTLNSQKTSTYGILLFAITATFAGVDWVMSLTPHWYSTMFGVYLFAGSAVSALASMSLIGLLLRRYGYLKDIITVEHYHDIGKLLYGFNVFWAYVAFSQYFLIWYANIPEETIFFVRHFQGSWNAVGILLAVGHFGVPFVLFMSRHAKRNFPFHTAMMIWFLFIHFVDLYWIIMPNVSPAGLSIKLVDVTTLLGIGGVYLFVFFNRLKKTALYPVKDPRLTESLHLENAL
jgi:hypothetical protein